MNNNIKLEIDRFLNNVCIAGEKISTFSKSIIEKDQNIRNIIESLNSSFEKINIDKKDNEFSKEINESIYIYKARIEQWLARVNSYMDGKEFINRFEKSMLVVILGNVNVGKSSIGNFISGSVDELKDYYDELPDYYLYDFADGIKENEPIKMEQNRFKENYTEETSTIQYYTLKNGLTWVDSPGIHSINGQNEDLAKKYVDYADLVLFVMSSASVAKYDEYVELSRLINKKKPLLAIINKSDKKEKDEVNGKIVTKFVPKTDKDRKSQEEYVKSLFEERKKDLVHIDSLDSISMSTLLAKEAIKNNDYKMFEDSGMPKFYGKLGELLKDNAIQLKTEAPKQRVNSLIKEILNGFNDIDNEFEGIIDMEESYKDILEKIDSSISKIKTLKKNILKEVRIKSIPQIDIYVSKLSLDLQKENTIEDNQAKINEIILNNFNEVISEKILKVINDFNYEKISTINLKMNTKLEAKYETLTYDVYSIKEVTRDPNGIIEHIGAIFGKTYYSIKSVRNQQEKKIIISDNSNEVIQNIIVNLEREIEPAVEKALDNICKKYFEVEKNIVKNILDIIEDTKNKLNNEVM